MVSKTTQTELADRKIAKIVEESCISVNPMLDNCKVMFAMAIHQDSPVYYFQE